MHPGLFNRKGRRSVNVSNNESPPRNEKRKRNKFDSSIDGIFIFNDKGYLCDMNPVAQDLSGLDESKNGLGCHFNNRIVRN